MGPSYCYWYHSRICHKKFWIQNNGRKGLIHGA